MCIRTASQVLLLLEETWDLTVCCQVLPRTTADTRAESDDAVSLLVGEVTACVSNDPTLGGLAVPGWTIRATIAGFKFEGGQLLNAGGAAIGAASRIELQLRVEASTC